MKSSLFDSPSLRLLGVACALAIGAPAAAHAANLGFGAWVGEFTPGGGFVQEDDVEAHTGANVTMIGGWEGGPHDGPFTWTVLERETGHATYGTWDYIGLPPLDLYLSIKYDGRYSIFHYPLVTTPDDGYWSDDPAHTGVPMTVKNNGDPFNVAQIRMWAAEPSPIPLPSTLAMFASALLSVFGLRRRGS